MASIQIRPKKGGKYQKRKKYKSGELQYNVLYRAEWEPEKGKYRQSSVTFQSREEAEKYLPEIQLAEDEHRRFFKPRQNEIRAAREDIGKGSKGIALWLSEERPKDKSQWTVSDLVHDYAIDKVRTNQWVGSTPRSSYGLIKNYIDRYIGTRKANSFDTKAFKDYFYGLLSEKAPRGGHKSDPGYVTVDTLYQIRKILNPAYDYGINEYRMFEYNPVHGVVLPKRDSEDYVRKQLTEEQVQFLINTCEDFELKLIISVMFSGTTRTGELKALQWKNVGISEADLSAGKPYIYIEHNLTRIDKYTLNSWAKKKERPIFVFPDIKTDNATSLVLKIPKTPTSCRKVYIPITVAKALQQHKKSQDEKKELLGKAYQDFGLIFCQDNGRPYGDDTLQNRFKKQIKLSGLPKVDFYSLRHSGATAKLRATKDIKAVQGDMGHKTPDMLMNVYAGMNEDDRIAMPKLIQDRVFDQITF